MRKYFWLAFFVITIICLVTACYLPEKFTANISIKADGSYTFQFKGILVYSPILSEIELNGTLTAQQEAELRSVSDFSDNPAVKKWTYLGKGRWDIEYNITSSSDDTFYFWDPMTAFLSISKNGKGVLITETGMDSEQAQDLINGGYQINGLITITSELPLMSASGVEVKKSGKKVTITQKITEIPKNEVIINFGEKMVENYAPASTQKPSSDFFEQTRVDPDMFKIKGDR